MVVTFFGTLLALIIYDVVKFLLFEFASILTKEILSILNH